MRDNIGYPEHLLDKKRLDDMLNEVKRFSLNLLFNCYLNTITYVDNLQYICTPKIQCLFYYRNI